MSKAEKIVHQMMFANDAFSQWLGIHVMEITDGRCLLRMEVRPEMTNGFNIGHGGISYSLADSALAFASNAGNNMSVSIETSISHVKPVFNGDTLFALAIRKTQSSKTGIYEVSVTNQHDELVALFKGTVYIKDKLWIDE